MIHKKKKKIIPHWKNNSIYYYSIKYLKQTKKNSSFYFLQCFKFYRIISKTRKVKSKVKINSIIFKMVKIKK
jgi:GT2 family glycosyltransferase